MRRICHVTSVHDRNDQRILAKECGSLVRAGYDVSLVVNDDLDNAICNGVRVLSTGRRPKNRISRIFQPDRTLLHLLLSVAADLYHFHDPDLMPIATKLRKRFGKTVIFDFHENTEKQIMDKNWIPVILRAPVARLYAWYEGSATKRYDALISVTPEIVQKLKKNNLNCVMVTNYPIIEPVGERRAERPTICFAGGITEQWNHDIIIEAIEQIDDVQYLLFGSGPQDYLDMLRALPGWKKVDFRGRVSHAEVKRAYYNATVGMALNYSTQIRGEGSLGNTKLFEYMEAGIPVICSDYTLWRNIVETHDCGIAVDPRNANEIAEAIRYLLNNPDNATKMGENGREAVMEHYNWETQERVLLDLYRSLLGA